MTPATTCMLVTADQVEEGRSPPTAHLTHLIPPDVAQCVFLGGGDDGRVYSTYPSSFPPSRIPPLILFPPPSSGNNHHHAKQASTWTYPSSCIITTTTYPLRYPVPTWQPPSCQLTTEISGFRIAQTELN